MGHFGLYILQHFSKNFSLPKIGGKNSDLRRSAAIAQKINNKSSDSFCFFNICVGAIVFFGMFVRPEKHGVLDAFQRLVL